MKKKIVVSIITLSVIFCIFFVFITYIATTRANGISLSDPDISTLSDGKYTGEYSLSPVYVKVRVSVTEHTISDIDILEHHNGLGDKAESIINSITDNQSVEVEAISGATISSRCILKAVENALSDK